MVSSGLWKLHKAVFEQDLSKKYREAYAKLWSVVGPVIQANGRLSFEDDLRSVGQLYCVSRVNRHPH